MKMKVLIITLTIAATIHKSNLKEKLNKRVRRQATSKEFNMNFGLSTALKERMHPEILEKSLSGNYVTKELFTLVMAPVMNEIERRITKLEAKDQKI